MADPGMQLLDQRLQRARLLPVVGMEPRNGLDGVLNGFRKDGRLFCHGVHSSLPAGSMSLNDPTWLAGHSTLVPS